MEGKRCTSCKKNVVNDPGSVSFKCPGCSDLEVVRCTNCRDNGSKYSCACGFTGPN
ncbi:MAG TPA: zinc finger domain-containing protein [Candidatus Nanoarchaeia archaeon]|nr:zinc finger domain-containing protein [Candidatus Nanoarchaeia archaeon]